ncbi:ferritin-like domain-containing protein [Bacillus sp. FJAT-42376]|uniref:ferritin-like domain-containing protein n=1 Tax=Bacillus sp. FJAT-42376 TaxID=2014076 RepID=UPI000F4DB5D0|nr:ferritin-like domain-containing protein [Bacillus sp. FJAT-42376]AZB42139.1 ferritin-like domain-containing protein [Bacillus sp. FJAT-42376]
MQYSYYEEYQRQMNQNALLAKDIAKALDGEYTAITCYEVLAKQAPTQEQRDKILEIRMDEKRHYEEISQIYLSLTGRQHKPQLTEECASTYEKGLNAAIKDEQETVDFYLNIYDKSTNAYIKRIFRRAASDEQNHAVWFLYYLTKL